MSYRSLLFLVTGGFAILTIVVVSLYAGLLSVAFEADMEMNLLSELSNSVFKPGELSVETIVTRYESSLKRLQRTLKRSAILKNLFARGLDENIDETLAQLKTAVVNDGYDRALEYVFVQVQGITNTHFGIQWRLTLAFLSVIVVLLIVYTASIYHISGRFKKQLSKLLLGIKALENHEYGYLVSVDKNDFIEIRTLIESFNLLSTAIKNADSILFGVLKQMVEGEEKRDR
ncbi:MAG: hypothetical protein J7J80_06375 [Thermotogae bacterium]|nr:hypothetical protein [Thermotogota bacterium]